MNKKWDHEWLYFSRKSRRGAIVFLLLFLIISILPRLTQLTQLSEVQVVRKELAVEMESSNADQLLAVLPPKVTDSFNPNNYTAEDWERLGFTARQAQVIESYKSSIGGFKSSRDFKSVYVVADTMYQKYAPLMFFTKEKMDENEHLSFRTNSAKEKTQKLEKKEKQAVEINASKFPLNLNKANTEELQAINGIGPYYAKLLLSYRSDLGGFIRIDQVNEIKTLPTPLVDSLKTYTYVHPDEVQRININDDKQLRLLVNHPYISKSSAHSIKVLKEQQGKFSSVEDILQSPYIDRSVFEKIKPYIRVGDL